MLNYYQLLATGNWKLATALSPSIRCTLYAIPDTSDERQATCDEFAPFCAFCADFCAFSASLRLTITIFTRLKIKVRPKGFHNFAFSLTSYGISSTKE